MERYIVIYRILVSHCNDGVDERLKTQVKSLKKQLIESKIWNEQAV